MQLGSLRFEIDNCVTLSIGFMFPITELDNSLGLVQDGKDYSMTLFFELTSSKNSISLKELSALMVFVSPRL